MDFVTLEETKPVTLNTMKSSELNKIICKFKVVIGNI